MALEDESELRGWSDCFASVSVKSTVRRYRDIYKAGVLFHKLMLRFCDDLAAMKIVKIEFGV